MLVFFLILMPFDVNKTKEENVVLCSERWFSEIADPARSPASFFLTKKANVVTFSEPGKAKKGGGGYGEKII